MEISNATVKETLTKYFEILTKKKTDDSFDVTWTGPKGIEWRNVAHNGSEFIIISHRGTQITLDTLEELVFFMVRVIDSSDVTLDAMIMMESAVW